MSVFDILLNKTKFEEKFGKLMFKFKTQNGLPPDIFIDELSKKIDLNKKTKLGILEEFLSQMTLHKLKSGVEFDSDNHDKLRERNLKILNDFNNTGEIGLY